MLRPPKTSPEQWVALAAVVDHGGYATPPKRSIGASRRSIIRSRAFNRRLGCRLLEVQGRRAVLTAQGEVLLARARGSCSKNGNALETYAQSLERGFEATLKLVVDAAFPRTRLLAALVAFKGRCPLTRLDLSEAVLSGAEEAIVDGAADGSADVVVTSRVPSGFLGNWLYETVFVACASPSHPLHGLDRALTPPRSFEQHQQVVLRDSTGHACASGRGFSWSGNPLERR